MFREYNTGLIHFSSGFNQSLEGFCLVLRSDGLLCCGEFQNNELNGKALIWKNDQCMIMGYTVAFFMGSFQHGQVKFIDQREYTLIEFFRWVSKQSNKFKFIKHKINNSYYFGIIDLKGKPSEIGLVIHEDGKLNHGQYHSGKLNGYCSLQLKNDDKFCGQCVDGKIEGVGIYYQAEQRKTYLGQFQKGECLKIIETLIGYPTSKQIIQLEGMVFRRNLPELHLQDFERFMFNSPQSTQSTQYSKSRISPFKQSKSLAIIENNRFEFNSTSTSIYKPKGQSKIIKQCQPYEIESNDSKHNELLSQSNSIMNPEEEDDVCRFKQIMENLHRIQQNAYLPSETTDHDSSQREIYNDVSHQQYLPGLEAQRPRMLSKAEEQKKLKPKTRQQSQTVQGPTYVQSSTQISQSNQKPSKHDDVVAIKTSNKGTQCYSSKPYRRESQQAKSQQGFSKSQKQTRIPVLLSSYSPQVECNFIQSIQIMKILPRPAFITIREIPSPNMSYQLLTQSAVLSIKI